MYCKNCGKEVEDNVKFCSYCGTSLNGKIEVPTCMKCGAEIVPGDKFCKECGNVLYEEPVVEKDGTEKINKRKKRNYIERMVIGIASIVLSLLVFLQACSTGIYNTMSNTGDLGGSAGFLVFLIMMIAGISAIATRKSEKKHTGVIIAVIYFLGAFFAFPNTAVFTDLKIWGGVCIFFGLFFLGSFVYVDKNDENESIFEFKCSNCGTEVQKGDTICPNCGTEVDTKVGPKQVLKLAGTIVAFLLVASLVAFQFYDDYRDKRDAENDATISPSDIQVEEEYNSNEEVTQNSAPINVGSAEDFSLSDYYAYDGRIITVSGEFDMDRNGEMHLYGYDQFIWLNGLTMDDANAIFEGGMNWIDATGMFWVDENGQMYLDVTDYVIHII